MSYQKDKHMDIAWMRALVEYWHNLKLSATRDAVKIALGIKPFCKSKDGQTQRNLLNFQKSSLTSGCKSYVISFRTNCEMEAKINIFREECGCKPYYFPGKNS